MGYKKEFQPEELKAHSEEERGVRFKERVDELDANIEQDLAPFLQTENKSPELAKIAAEGRELAARTRRAVSERMEAWKKNPLFKPLVMAAALHALPAIPVAIEHMRNETEGWDEGFVIRPQDEVAKQAALEKIAKREARIDKDARNRTKQAFREKMERGERITFKKLYFDMERVNGVEPALVNEAEQKAEQLIEKYSADAQDGLDEPLIKRMVDDMYGPEKAYQWGQGSVSEYFVNGIRQCSSIAKGELIVFEGVVLRLPEDVQKRYGLGLQKVEQHEIATFSVDGQTYLLETPFRREEADRGGTASIGLDVVKKGIVSEKPLFIQARPGENINSGPRIDVVVNSPVDDGIVVEGKLRASDYVEHVVKERKIVPKMDEIGTIETGFVEIHSDERVAARVSPELYMMDEVDQPKQVSTVEDVRHIKQEQIERESGRRSDFQSYNLSTSQLSSPSPEAVSELAGLDSEKTLLRIGTDAGVWDTASITQLFKLPYTRVQIDSPSGAVLEYLKTHLLEDVHKTLRLGVQNLSPQDLQEILKNIQGSPGVLEIDVSPHISQREQQLFVISNSGRQTEIQLTAYGNGSEGDTFGHFTPFEVEAIGTSKAKLLMSGAALDELSKIDAFLLRQKNIGYNNEPQIDKEKLKVLYDRVREVAPERMDLLEGLARSLNAAG